MGGADLLFCLCAERLNERLKRIPPLDKIHSQGGHMLATTTQVPTRAHVTPETDLADLCAIKSAWVQAARDLDYPNLAWKVVRNLGRREKFGVLRETYYWEALDGKVRLLGDENTVKYSPQHRAYVVRRYVAAYVMPEMFETRFARPEQAIMSGHQVLRWAWLMAETPDGSLCEEDESQKKTSCSSSPASGRTKSCAYRLKQKRSSKPPPMRKPKPTANNCWPNFSLAWRCNRETNPTKTTESEVKRT
jgi:hypothetical protein